MSRKAWIGIAIVVGVAVVILAIWATRHQDPDVIKIAFIAPLTGDGAVYGVPQRNAAQVAVDEINAQGGLLGKKLELVPFDDKASPKEATTIANKICVMKGVVAVVGHPNSGTAIPASKLYNRRGIPFVVTTATNPVITHQGFNNVFRFAPTDDMQGSSAAHFIYHKLSVHKLVIIHDNTAYGKGLAENVKGTFASLGGDVPLYDAIMPGQQEYRGIIAKISEKKPKAVFYGGMMPEGAKLVRQAKELGLDTIFIFGDGCFDEQFRNLSRTDCRNVYISFLAPPWEKLTSANKFCQKYKAQFHSLPAFAPYGYDGIMVVAEAIRRAKSTDAQKLIRALHDPTFSLQGVTGKITFNNRGQTVDRRFYFYTFDTRGQLVLHE